MGKLGKTVVDQIHTLLEQGFNKTEVASKLGINRKTVATYAVDTGPSLVQVDFGKVSLSLDDDITRLLYDMQGVMGAPSIIGAVKQAYQNEVSLARLRVTHWEVYSGGDEGFTAEAMIQHLLSFIDYQEDELKDNMKSLRDAEAEIERLTELAEEKFEEGLEEGRRDNAIYVRCAYCGKPYQVTPLSETHREITKALLDLGWGHAACVSRDEYQRGAGSRALGAALSF
ncbi:MAG: hypothetical protein NWE88_01935 [Candidatus Bathyarchaeota archaeon]|nr:hypothetical protein [Candidatus Bathyarchaeota archaeon]